MNIVDLRTELGLTQEAFAARLGLGSKGYVSELEKGGRCSVRVALAIETLSSGRIPAAALNPDVALVDQVRASRPIAAPSAEAA